MMIKTIMSLMKKKGVELSAEELAEMIEDPNKPNLDADANEIKHNRKVIENMKLEMQETINNLQKEFAKQIDDFKLTISSLQEENKSLLTALADEKAQRDSVLKLQSERAEAERLKQIETLIDEATKDGRLPIENKELQEKYKQILTNDLEAGKVVLSALPKPTVNALQETKVNKPTLNTVNPLDAYLNEFQVM